MNSVLNKFANFVLNHGARYDFFRSLGEAARVLDIGCGRGANGSELIKFHPQLDIHGIDLIDNHEVPGFISYKKVDLNNNILPYQDSYFDAIVCTHVIEHLSAPMELGSEISRVLKAGGYIYVEAPNWTSMFVPSFGFKRAQHDPFNFFDDPTHVKPWTKHGLFELLSGSCMLEFVDVGAVRNWRRIFVEPALILYGLLLGKRGLVVSSFWNIYGWSIYGVAKKQGYPANNF